MLSAATGADEKVFTHMPRSGMWVWGPDARALLGIESAKSCAGGRVRRPFQRAEPLNHAVKARPTGPPNK